MEIILLEKVQNLGDLGASVKVANGYARNFLIPQKKAMRATEEAKIKVEERRRQLAQEEGKRREVAQARADLTARKITITRLVAEGGNLYGSVSPTDIAEALTTDGVSIGKSEVFQPDGPVKQAGKFAAEIILHPEVRFSVDIIVAAESAPPLSTIEAVEAFEVPELHDPVEIPDMPDMPDTPEIPETPAKA